MVITLCSQYLIHNDKYKGKKCSCQFNYRSYNSSKVIYYATSINPNNKKNNSENLNNPITSTPFDKED